MRYTAPPAAAPLASAATRGAQEWLDALQQVGREVFAFLLEAEWDDAVTRLVQRHEGKPDMLFQVFQQVGVYALYEHRHPYATLPAISTLHERAIGTTRRSVQDLADEIMTTAGL